MSNLSELLKERLGIDCGILGDGDHLLIQYVDGCATSQVKAIADELGLSASIDRSFSEENFTDFAVDFALELGIAIADVRFKKDGDRYKVIIPENEIGEKLQGVV